MSTISGLLKSTILSGIIAPYYYYYYYCIILASLQTSFSLSVTRCQSSVQSTSDQEIKAIYPSTLQIYHIL